MKVNIVDLPCFGEKKELESKFTLHLWCCYGQQEIPLRLWKMSPSAEQEKLDIPISLSNEELSEKLLSFSNQVNRFVLKIFAFLIKISLF